MKSLQEKEAFKQTIKASKNKVLNKNTNYLNGDIKFVN